MFITSYHLTPKLAYLLILLTYLLWNGKRIQLLWEDNEKELHRDVDSTSYRDTKIHLFASLAGKNLDVLVYNEITELCKTKSGWGSSHKMLYAIAQGYA